MRLHRWILAVARWLVPRGLRADWRAEWEAEIHHRESTLQTWTLRQGWLDLVRRSSGAFWDALWLQSSRWYSLRLFARHWRLGLTALVSLTVALAATVLGLSAYNALLLRPPGVDHPNSLRLIHIRTTADPFGDASYPEFDAYRNQTRAFADVAAFPYSIASINLTAGNRGEHVVSTQVSNNFFSVLGIKARAGTLAFRASPAGDIDDIVIGEVLWKKLGGGPAVVGQTIRLNDQPVTIVGIAPASFLGMTWGFNPDVWMSFKTSVKVLGGSPTTLTDRTQRTLKMVGRLKPTMSDAQASADVQLIAAAIEREHPDTDKGRGAVLSAVTVTPPGDRPWMSMILGALILVVLLTLVVACANVTNLLLGLSTARRHETLVRAALGASRLQLVLPPLRESALLGLISGVLGYGGAWVALVKLAQFSPSVGEFLPSISLDLRPDALVLAATLTIALVAGVGVGVVPALRGASEGLSGALNRERAIGEPRKARIRNVLVALQMAIATVVLVGVGISVHSLINLQRVSLGFSARNLVFGGVDMARSGYDAHTGPAFYERVRERLSARPDIQAVALADNPPMTGYATDHVVAEGDPPPPDGHGVATPYAIVDDNYFSTLGITLLQGRTFDSRDQRGRTEVIVINATLARRHWPGGSPIGRRLRIDNGNRLVEVIGVVADGKYADVTEDQLPFMYFALSQRYVSPITVIARTSEPRDSVVLALADINPNIVLGGVGLMTLDDTLRLSMLVPRVIVWTTMGFAVLALALAVFGLYSTVFYAVSQRRIELGIRTTLGATPLDLFRMVLREAGWVALAGAAAGVAAGLALLPFASSIFYGIGRAEPQVFAGVILTCGAIAVGTSYLVVRPWTRLTPHQLLRQ